MVIVMKKTVRVVHIITGLGVGGAEYALYNLLQSGLKEEFDNYVISLSDIGTIGKKIEALDVPVTAIGLKSSPLKFRSLLEFRRVICGFQPDLIQGWMYHGNLFAALAKIVQRNRTVLVWNIRHSLYDLSHEKFITRQIIRANRVLSALPEALLYNSQLSRDQHEGFGFAAGNGQVIPNGIDLERFRFEGGAQCAMRAKLGIPENSLVIGHVARLHPMKGHTEFLNAAGMVSLRCHNAHFVLIGRGVSIDNPSLRKYIPGSELDRFHLLGERSDVPDLMCAMDVFCQSSWSEAFPNVLGEAMASRLPCVATDVGDSALILGSCGVLIAPNDKAGLVAGMVSLLSLSAQDRLFLGARARSRIKENFDLKTIVQRYKALYKTLVSQ